MSKPAMLAAGLAALLVGLSGLAVTFASYQMLSGGVGYPDAGIRDGGPAAGMTGGRVDAMFIEQMIPHHDDAIAMSDLALTRAEHPELRQLAQSIKQAQTAENAQMREWYSRWFGFDVPTATSGRPGMGGPMMGGRMTDLPALVEADSFDKAFIEQMIPHHEMAIMMSRMAGRASARPEMRDFTQRIIDAQSREIVQMQEWYREWYGR
jgi:uncharacterized protein (DUF305 family)